MKNLKEMWWHRLFTVIFIIATLIFSAIVTIIAFSSSNTIKVNEVHYLKLRDFVYDQYSQFKNEKAFWSHDKELIPSFLATPGKTGCISNNNAKISDVWTYDLYDNTYCTLSFGANSIALSNFLSVSDAREIQPTGFIPYDEAAFIANLEKERPDGGCLITKSYCDGDVIKYKYNWFHYFNITWQVLLVISIWIIFWSLLYYKGLLYIIFGSDK